MGFWEVIVFGSHTGNKYFMYMLNKLPLQKMTVASFSNGQFDSFLKENEKSSVYRNDRLWVWWLFQNYKCCNFWSNKKTKLICILCKIRRNQNGKCIHFLFNTFTHMKQEGLKIKIVWIETFRRIKENFEPIVMT